jgi:hypothetical protein
MERVEREGVRGIAYVTQSIPNKTRFVETDPKKPSIHSDPNEKQ